MANTHRFDEAGSTRSMHIHAQRAPRLEPYGAFIYICSEYHLPRPDVYELGQPENGKTIRRSYLVNHCEF